MLAYLGIRNENLKVLAQRLGVENTTNIPDKINQINYTGLLTISEEELNNISETYKTVLMDSIPEANYSKQTEAVIQKDGISYTTTSYRLDLSSQEISDILVKILNALKTDSITLNMLATKAKTLGLNEYSTVDGISKEVDNAIASIQQNHFTDTSFVVYNYEGKTIATEILVKNEEKVTIFNDENNIKITVENLTNSANYDIITIDVSYRITSTASSILIKVSQDGEDKASINLTNTGSAAQGNLQTDITAMLAIQEETVELNYTQTLEFIDEIENMIELNETNCAILNDYSQEQLNGLLGAVMNQIEVVINQKMQVLGLVSSEEEQVEAENVQQSEQMQQI